MSNATTPAVPPVPPPSLHDRIIGLLDEHTPSARAELCRIAAGLRVWQLAAMPGELVDRLEAAL